MIGSVLVASTKPISSERRVRLSESVGQAALIIANHRNLALAEMHALSDTLTGLPNRRRPKQRICATPLSCEDARYERGNEPHPS